jgi:2-keto-4-pentenoate hydratase/2-oxohepta-3-ene-1,7-dioic acid hydratase in catechol pathway
VKLVSYRADGKEHYGVVFPEGIVDASSRLEGAATLRDVLEQERIAEMRELAASGLADHALDDVEYALPITAPRKILCAGRNYRGYHEVVEHAKTPDFPSIFGRFASSFSPHRQAILKPKAGDQLDYEGELVVVIGKRGRHIPEANAFDYVAGYTCMNEGTVRDWMSKGTQNTPAKNFYRSGGLGPWMVTVDEIPDPSQLRIVTRRNGTVVQDGGTELMIFSIPYLIAHISKFTVLEPGDLIATGSPGGSAIESPSPEWLRAGDEIEIEISGIGVLRNPIMSE